MVDEVLLNKVNSWWESLDTSVKSEILQADKDYEEFRQSYKETDGIPLGAAYDDSVDEDEFVSVYWDSFNEDEKVQIYNEWSTENESKSTVLDFESFIKENYKK